MHSGNSTVFSLSWRALARRLRLCVDPRPRYLTPDDTRRRSELLDCDFAIFLTSSDSAASALLGYAQEEQEMFEGEEVETEPSQSSCTANE